jgi:putative sigma-54 modulation protein
MNIKIQTLHFDADGKLETFVESKVSKLLAKHQDVLGAEITLRLDKSTQNENKIAEIRLDVPGSNLFAKKQSKTFEESTDTALEALKKQLLKYKDKKTGK